MGLLNLNGRHSKLSGSLYVDAIVIEEHRLLRSHVPRIENMLEAWRLRFTKTEP